MQIAIIQSLPTFHSLPRESCPWASSLYRDLFRKGTKLTFFLESQGDATESCPFAPCHFPRPRALGMSTNVTTLWVPWALMGGGWQCVGV